MKAFVNQQRENYQNFTILGEANPDLLSIGESIISPLPIAIGYRFWYGYKQRMEIISAMNGETKIAEASVCVATRFHGAIFSITSDVPTIAVPYDVKVRRLFQFLNLGEWIADPTFEILNDDDWNSRLYGMIQAALKGRFQPDYSKLKAGMKTHQEALVDLSLFIRN